VPHPVTTLRSPTRCRRPPLPPELKPEDVTIGATQDYKDAGYHIRFTVFRYRELGESPYRPTHHSVAVEVRATVLQSLVEWSDIR
jgi:hypothetical protein